MRNFEFEEFYYNRVCERGDEGRHASQYCYDVMATPPVIQDVVKGFKFCAAQRQGLNSISTDIDPVKSVGSPTYATGYECQAPRVPCDPKTLDDISLLDKTICVLDLEDCPITAVSFEPKEGFKPVEHVGVRNVAGSWHTPEQEALIRSLNHTKENDTYYPLIYYSKDPKHGNPIQKPVIHQGATPCQSRNEFATTNKSKFYLGELRAHSQCDGDRLVQDARPGMNYTTFPMTGLRSLSEYEF